MSIYGHLNIKYCRYIYLYRKLLCKYVFETNVTNVILTISAFVSGDKSSLQISVACVLERPPHLVLPSTSNNSMSSLDVQCNGVPILNLRLHLI